MVFYHWKNFKIFFLIFFKIKIFQKTGSTHLIRPESFLNDTGDLTRVTVINYDDQFEVG